MLKEMEDIINLNMEFFPLETYSHIVEGNALRMDWKEVVPKNKLDYIMGNPPFLGAANMNKEQKEDIIKVFNNLPGCKSLDYVAAWYKLASEYIVGTEIEVAFVSTNSIVQGLQPEILWKNLFEQDIKINFAYRTFIWESEASNKASVHCVIIGFALKDRQEKILYEGCFLNKVDRINGYLNDAKDIYISKRNNPISPVPKMIRGSSPCDNGNYSFSQEEVEEFIRRNPNLEKFIKSFIGAREFINRIPRYCIWLDDASPEDINSSSDLRERIENVVEFRKKSRNVITRKRAETPLEWETNRYTESNSILIPRVSSENRRYIPIGFLDGQTVPNDSVQIIPNTNIFHFGVLTSNVHNGWMRVVAGRLKSDYRYSGIVYNNFP